MTPGSINDTCIVEISGFRCDRRVYNKSLSLCTAHNLQRLKGREFKTPRVRKKPHLSKDCSFTGCDKPATALELCSTHYSQMKRSGELTPIQPYRSSDEVKYGNESGEKQCVVCEEWYQESRFTPQDSGSSDGLKSECKDCAKLRVNKYESSFSVDERRDRHLRLQYGKSLQWFDERLASQSGGCAICGSEKPNGRWWHVDHDHSCCPGVRSCGECVRGILCGSCNSGIGLLRDSPEVIYAAYEYLMKSKESNV